MNTYESNSITYSDFNTTDGSAIPVEQDNSLNSTSQVLLKVDFKTWGDSVKADKEEMTIDADKRLLSLQKKLIECRAYEEIKSLTKKIGKKILRLALPASKSFRAGFYRVPLECLEQLNDMLSKEQYYFNQAVESFLNAFATAKEKAACSREYGGLGALYRESDYPSITELESRFSMSWQFISFSVPSALPERMREEATASFLASLESAREECVEALRTGFSGLIDRATERLKERSDGKRQSFQESLTTQLNEFIDTFSARNSLANDSALAQLVDKARGIMSLCPDLKYLKDNEAMRKIVQGKFSEIQQEITSANLVPKKGRAMQVSPQES
jgi:hypothetical protein